MRYWIIVLAALTMPLCALAQQKDSPLSGWYLGGRFKLGFEICQQSKCYRHDDEKGLKFNLFVRRDLRIEERGGDHGIDIYRHGVRQIDGRLDRKYELTSNALIYTQKADELEFVITFVRNGKDSCLITAVVNIEKPGFTARPLFELVECRMRKSY